MPPRERWGKLSTIRSRRVAERPRAASLVSTSSQGAIVSTIHITKHGAPSRNSRAAKRAVVALAASALALMLTGCSLLTPSAPSTRTTGSSEYNPRSEDGHIDFIFEDDVDDDPGFDDNLDADDDSTSALSSSEALDLYVEIERLQYDTLMALYSDTFSDFSVEPTYPSTITYSYTYLNPIPGTPSSEKTADLAAELQSLLDESVFPIMINFGVVDPVAVYTYINPDGSIVWTQAFTPSS